VQRDLQFQRGEDPRADLRAQVVHVVDRARIPFGPDDPAVAGVGQLRRHCQPWSGDFDGAREHVVHPDHAADLADVRVVGTQSERGAAR
jgi:hypothetical protein